jgi:hypothetical protein
LIFENFTGMCDVNQCLSNFFDVSVLRIWREICWVGTVLAEFSRGKETCSMRAGDESGLCFFFFLERNGRTDSYGSSNFTGMCDVNQCLSNFFDVSLLRIWWEIFWVGTVLAEFSRGKETCSMRAGGESGLCFFFFWRETVERILTVHQILQACVMLINACQIFLMFRYYAYGEKYVELVQFWLNFLEERRLVAWGRGAKVASVFFFFLERNGRTDSYGSWIN